MVALKPANCFKNHLQLHRFEPDGEIDLDVYAQTLLVSKSPGSSRYASQGAIEEAAVAILSKIGISDAWENRKNRIIMKTKPLNF